jgi:hypothetical protein
VPGEGEVPPKRVPQTKTNGGWRWLGGWEGVDGWHRRQAGGDEGVRAGITERMVAW